jgi:hypothetical protein
MNRLMFFSIVLLSTSAVMCMDRTDSDGNLSGFNIGGASYDRDADTGSWSVSIDPSYADRVDIAIDNTIASYYESQK